MLLKIILVLALIIVIDAAVSVPLILSIVTGFAKEYKEVDVIETMH